VRVISSPALYAAWLLLVIVALTGTYFMHPYVFAFTTLGLGWATAAMAILGCAVCVLAKTRGWGAKLTILGYLALSGVAVYAALAVLSTFKWA